MRTWIAAMLLASATAVPAYAQNHDHDGHGGGQHQDGGQHGGGQGGQHQGGGGRPGIAPGAGQAQHFQAPVQQARPGGGGGDLAQHDRGPGGQGGMRPAQGFDGGGDPRHFNGRQENGVQVWQGQSGGRDEHGRQMPNGNPAARDWNGQRGDRGQGWNGGRPNNGGNWNGDRRGGGGGAWNRGWRQDQRYNWQGWRSQHGDLFRAGRYRPPYGAGYGYRRFGIGYRIDPIFFAQDYWIDNPDYYRLPPAYGPYRWVRYYNDALLIDLEDGEVVDAIPNFFY